MMTAKVDAIYIARDAGAAMEYLQEASLMAGRGIEGDRYFSGAGTFSKKLTGLPDREVTLIEAEEIDRFNAQQGLSLNYGDLRRNIITRGVRLNDLVDREFRIGSVEFRGIRLCEPCDYLAKMVTAKVLKGMVHRAGLRACILTDGMIRESDPISTMYSKRLTIF